MEQAMASPDDADRAIRRRMRVYPQKPPASAAPKNKLPNVPIDSRNVPSENRDIKGRKAA
jgi:hypothetical protein